MTKFPVIAESPGQSPRPGLATMSFPASFLWGVSTAGHQVEGGNDNSQWSAWEAAGKTKCRAVSGLACDWWNNAERDFDLAQEMGLNAQGACDFVGVNVYSRFHVAFSFKHAAQLFSNVYVPEHVPQGDAGMDKPYGEAYPGAVAVAVERCARLGKPIYILENGGPDAQDRIRPWLIINVLRELHRLISEGKDIRGYFHWTLIDNFEWSEGWRLRFGLFEMDTSTQRRTMRPSARLYSTIVQANGIAEEISQAFPHAWSRASSKRRPRKAPISASA